MLGNWRKPPETQNRNKNGNDYGAAADRLQDLLEWLEDSTENLEDTEVPDSANFLHDHRFETSCESGTEEAQY